MGLDSFKNNFLQLKCIKKHNARAVNCENSSKAYSPSKLIFKLLKTLIYPLVFIKYLDEFFMGRICVICKK